MQKSDTEAWKLVMRLVLLFTSVKLYLPDQCIVFVLSSESLHLNYWRWVH